MTLVYSRISHLIESALWGLGVLYLASSSLRIAESNQLATLAAVGGVCIVTLIWATWGPGRSPKS